MDTDFTEKIQELINLSDNKKIIELIKQRIQENDEDIEFLEFAGNVLLEIDEIEEAYHILKKSCEYDCNINYGVEKFFNLGQIVGGFDGLKLFKIGTEYLYKQICLLEKNEENNDSKLLALIEKSGSKEKALTHLKREIIKGVSSSVEIWMTDLCMETEAEQECENLIQLLQKIDKNDPQVWLLLSSVRISQNRSEEAKDALNKSFFYYKNLMKEIYLLMTTSKETDLTDSTNRYMSLVFHFLNICKMGLELGLNNLVLNAASILHEIDENIPDSYYYEALSYLFSACYLIYADQKITIDNLISKFIDYLKKSDDDEILLFLNEATSSLKCAQKILERTNSTSDNPISSNIELLLKKLDGININSLHSLNDQELNLDNENLDEIFD